MKNVEDRFSGVARNYARFRPDYPPELFDWIAQSSPRPHCVWDAATGNGQAAHALATRFDTVMATDVSPEQIAAATPHARIEFSVSRSEKTPFRNDSFDAITVATALHWFDFEAFCREAARVLGPGGIVVAWSYIWSEPSPYRRIIEPAIGNRLDPYWSPSVVQARDGYPDFTAPLEPFTAPSFELRARWSFDRFLAYARTWSAVSAYCEATGEDPFADVEEELRDRWGDGPWSLTWPLQITAARKPRSS